MLPILIGIALHAPGLLFAGAPAAGQRYVVTLQPGETVDGARTMNDLAAQYGGTVSHASGDTFTMLLPVSRARLVGADPRVQSVTPARNAASGAIAANAIPEEVVQWASGVSYTYDASGNIRQAGADAFAYDHVGRLVKAEINGVIREYDYDAFGNRLKCAQNPRTASAADCQPGFTIRSTDNRIEEATYDPSGKGNVVALAGHYYSYDAVEMMTRAVSFDATREFLYTAGDQRLATYWVNSGSWRWSIRDTSGKVLREFTSQDGAVAGAGTPQWARDYVWRKDGLLASRHPAGGAAVTYHYHVDHLGTPRRVTDDRDNLVGFHDYHAYGPEVSGSVNEPSAAPMKYTGHERDTVADPKGTLDYMHARYYHPMLGRFLSADKVLGRSARPQSWNRFAYAYNNPVNNTDPDGNFVIVQKDWRKDVGHAYANSPTFRAQFDAAHQNNKIVSRINLTMPMNNNTRAGTVPVSTSPMIAPGGQSVMRNATGQLIVRGTAFVSSIPVGSNMAVVGHELKHVNEGATHGYVFTGKTLIPLAPTIFVNTTATGGGNHYESTDAQQTEAQIQQELDAGGNAKLTPAEKANIFGPSEKFDEMNGKQQKQCSTDPTCFSNSAPPTSEPKS